jgi:hypothetical protein
MYSARVKSAHSVADTDAVLDLATSLPAVRIGGNVEVWPLIELDGDTRGPTGHRGHGQHG